MAYVGAEHEFHDTQFVREGADDGKTATSLLLFLERHRIDNLGIDDLVLMEESDHPFVIVDS